MVRRFCGATTSRKMVHEWSTSFSITYQLNGPLMVRWFQGHEKSLYGMDGPQMVSRFC